MSSLFPATNVSWILNFEGSDLTATERIRMSGLGEKQCDVQVRVYRAVIFIID